MSKYIIEIEDEPLWRQSALYGEEGLYRAKGFNSLVFDKFGLDKLTSLDKELEEAYQKGKHDAEQDLARAAYDEAYQKGYDDEEREEAINMLKKDLREATARADYFEREKEKESHYLRGVIDGLKFSIRCNGVSGAEVQ